MTLFYYLKLFLWYWTNIVQYFGGLQHNLQNSFKEVYNVFNIKKRRKKFNLLKRSVLELFSISMWVDM